MRKTLTLIALAAALGVPGHAFAGGGGHGTAPKEKWLAESEIKSKLSELGYTVREIEIEDDRYEVEATDKQGAKVELHVNPVTGGIEKREGSGKERD